MPDCRILLVEDATATDDEALIGENCHIVAEAENGPRGKSTMAAETRDKYGNLILLCRNHHRTIDLQFNTYPVERLHEIKLEHEKWVVQTLEEFDPIRQREEEQYASIVDEWANRCRVQSWEIWTSHMLGSGQPRLSIELDESLDSASKWLLSRIWPNRYPNLEMAFINFRMVLADLRSTFHEHAEQKGDMVVTEKFYKLIWHKNPEDYDRLARQYDDHVDLIHDLVFELTRAANHIFVSVRRDISHHYRETEGFLTLSRGPNMNLGWDTYLTKYSLENLELIPPYQGLNNFLSMLENRDFYFSRPASKA